MKLIFTKNYDELQDILSTIGGKWDEAQTNKKVLRLNNGIMNWYESTGTIQFQGKQEDKEYLEKLVKSLLYPEEFGNSDDVTPEAPIDTSVKETVTIDEEEKDITSEYLQGNFENSEIIIGIVSAVGTETHRVVTPLTDRLQRFGYNVEEIKVSSLLSSDPTPNEYERIKCLMNAGDDLRKSTNNNAILAYGTAKLIQEKRDEAVDKKAYIINSLKHPDEVEILRKIYGQGFYLFGIHCDKKRRLHYLTEDKGFTTTEANELTNIDEDENIKHGQRTRDTYHLSDFFINFTQNDDLRKNTIQRFLELIFSHPYKNPTFDEFSMFMAFSSSVRSGDLSRQVGAVITKNQQIIATGTNECPASGGGLYWAQIDEESGKVIDINDGKDFTRNEDSNKAEQNEIIQGIVASVSDVEEVSDDCIRAVKEVLEKSRIRDLTEFGRVVHAEMEAILSCARAGINCIGSTLYCTTFPCHNCAKHIIASGIERVVYVEPYPKSKALEFHSDSIELRTKLDPTKESDQVVFEPFTGVGARRFLDFFSMNLGVGNKLKRKDKGGHTVTWEIGEATPRVSLFPKSYLDIEKFAAETFNKSRTKED